MTHDEVARLIRIEEKIDAMAGREHAAKNVLANWCDTMEDEANSRAWHFNDQYLAACLVLGREPKDFEAERIARFNSGK